MATQAEPRPNFRGAPSRFLAIIAPNLPILLFMAAGLLTEAILLVQARDKLLEIGSATAILFVLSLFLVWWTMGWGLWFVSSRLINLMRRWKWWTRLIANSVLMIALAFCVLVYLSSWGLWLKTGRFANIESIQFALAHFHVLYFFHTERSSLPGFGLLAVAAVAFIVVWFRWAARTRWSPFGSPQLNRARRIVWYSLGLAWAASLLWVAADKSELRREPRMEALRYQFHPLFALVASWKQSLTEEKIEPLLDVRVLRPITTGEWKAPVGGDRPDIIFVAFESLRHDVVHLVHQGQEVTSNLNVLAREGLHLTRAYAQSTHSDYSDVCVASSLYPLRKRRHHFYQTDDPWPKTLIYDLLKPANYATAIISSQNEGWGGMEKFLRSPNLDVFYDAQRFSGRTRISDMDTGFAQEVRLGALRAGSLDDAHTTDVAIDWITEQIKRESPYYLAINFQSSHFPYEIPASCPRPFQPSKIDFEVSFVDYPVEKTEVVRNAYYNALHESDRQLGRLIAVLRKSGRLERTILVAYGENGQAFHENDRVTHAREPFEPVVHIACVIHAPALVPAKVEDYPVELIDIAPTVLRLMGWPSHPNFQGINFLGEDRPPLDRRALFFHTENPLTRTDAVLLAGRWKYHHDRFTNRDALFDLASDPKESANVSDRYTGMRDALRGLLDAWRRQQLAYYHFPFYYKNYHPPRSTRLTETGLVERVQTVAQ